MGPSRGAAAQRDRKVLKGELRRAVTAAAQNGYAGIGLRMRDYRRAVEEGRRDADLRAMLADSDVEVVELEVVWDWAETGERGRRYIDKEAEFYRVADAVGGRYLIANSSLGAVTRRPNCWPPSPTEPPTTDWWLRSSSCLGPT